MKNLSRRFFLQNVGIGVGGTAIAAALPAFINKYKTNAADYEEKKLNIAQISITHE